MTQDVQFKIRMPGELKDRLEEVASAAGRSTNAEIVQRLEASFPSVERLVVKNRLTELVMAMEAARAAEVKLGTLEERLAAPGISGPEKSGLQAEARKLGASVVMLKELIARLDADLDLVRNTEAGQAILDKPIGAKPSKKAASKKR